jgi:hypothetical protein
MLLFAGVAIQKLLSSTYTRLMDGAISRLNLWLRSLHVGALKHAQAKLHKAKI